MVPVALTLITMLLSVAKEVKDLLKYKELWKDLCALHFNYFNSD